jgi:potassium-dependent mechanosensitive channel
MKLLAAKIFWVVLLTALFVMPPGVGAQKQPPTPPPEPAKPEKPPEVPDLAELILRSNKLSNHLAVLETKITSGPDVQALEKDLKKLEARLAQYPHIIEQMEASPVLNLEQIAAYKDTIRLSADDLEDIIQPLAKAIRNLSEARTEWLAERKRWQEWQSELLTDGGLAEIKTIFTNAQNTIDSALLLINQQLQPLLVLLQETGKVDSTINRLIAELDNLASARRRALMPAETAPMFSWTYLAQLKDLTWFEAERGMQSLAWPKPEFYKNQGWILGLQVFSTLVIILLIFRYRDQIMESERWRFLAERPFAAGIILGIYPYFFLMSVLPSFIHLLYYLVIGFAIVRLLGALFKDFAKRMLLYILLFFIVTLQFFYFINLPQPLIRLYIFFASLVGLGLCSWQGLRSARRDSPRITWLFVLGVILFLVVLLAEISGDSGFAEYFFRSALRTVGWLFLAWILFYVTSGGVEVLLHSALLQRVPLMRDHAPALIRQVGLGVKVCISGATLAMILMVWRVFDNPSAAIQGVLSWGFTIGSQKITLVLILIALAVLYGSFILSWVIQNLILEDKTARQKMGPGGQQSLASLIQYALVFVGLLVALAVLGIDLTKITIVLGALGVGIGFGLQQIVNNLVCGIILLVERPIRVGDYIQLSSGDWAEVKRIGLRATRVLTFDRADIMIPNGDLITREVINWTFSDRFARLKLPVGVAYGSDTTQVLNILMEVANEDKAVVQYPAPYAFFNGFGESSLNFELRVYLLDLDNWFTVYGRLYQEIERKLREAGFTIPFPQRDLHLVSVKPGILDKEAAPETLAPRAAANPSREEPGE